MARNFRGTKFSRDKIFADWPLAKISRKKIRGLMIAKPRPYLVPANHTHITRAVMAPANEFSVERMVRGTTFIKISGIQSLAKSSHVKESPVL